MYSFAQIHAYTHMLTHFRNHKIIPLPPVPIHYCRVFSCFPPVFMYTLFHSETLSPNNLNIFVQFFENPFKEFQNCFIQTPITTTTTTKTTEKEIRICFAVPHSHSILPILVDFNVDKFNNLS